MMECGSAGFAKDENDCDLCKCADVAPMACPMYKCPATDCSLGFEQDENGCQTCDCAEDPCLGLNCQLRSGQDQICVPYRIEGCRHCPLTPRCVGGSDLSRVHIVLKYEATSEVDKFIGEDFASLVATSVAQLMKVDDTSVEFVRVRPLTPTKILASFDVVAPDYAVAAFERLKSRISLDSSAASWILYRAVSFVPDPSSLQSVYYVPEEELDRDDENPGWNRHLVVVVVGGVFAALASLVLVTACVVVCVCVRRRRIQAQSFSNYKLLPTSRNA